MNRKGKLSRKILSFFCYENTPKSLIDNLYEILNHPFNERQVTVIATQYLREEFKGDPRIVALIKTYLEETEEILHYHKCEIDFKWILKRISALFFVFAQLIHSAHLLLRSYALLRQLDARIHEYRLDAELAKAYIFALEKRKQILLKYNLVLNSPFQEKIVERSVRIIEEDHLDPLQLMRIITALRFIKPSAILLYRFLSKADGMDEEYSMLLRKKNCLKKMLEILALYVLFLPPYQKLYERIFKMLSHEALHALISYYSNIRIIEWGTNLPLEKSWLEVLRLKFFQEKELINTFLFPSSSVIRTPISISLGSSQKRKVNADLVLRVVNNYLSMPRNLLLKSFSRLLDRSPFLHNICPIFLFSCIVYFRDFYLDNLSETFNPFHYFLYIYSNLLNNQASPDAKMIHQKILKACDDHSYFAKESSFRLLGYQINVKLNEISEKNSQDSLITDYSRLLCRKYFEKGSIALPIFALSQKEQKLILEKFSNLYSSSGITIYHQILNYYLSSSPKCDYSQWDYSKLCRILPQIPCQSYVNPYSLEIPFHEFEYDYLIYVKKFKQQYAKRLVELSFISPNLILTSIVAGSSFNAEVLLDMVATIIPRIDEIHSVFNEIILLATSPIIYNLLFDYEFVHRFFSYSSAKLVKEASKISILGDKIASEDMYWAQYIDNTFEKFGIVKELVDILFCVKVRIKSSFCASVLNKWGFDILSTISERRPSLEFNECEESKNTRRKSQLVTDAVKNKELVEMLASSDISIYELLEEHGFYQNERRIHNFLAWLLFLEKPSEKIMKFTSLLVTKFLEVSKDREIINVVLVSKIVEVSHKHNFYFNAPIKLSQTCQEILAPEFFYRMSQSGLVTTKDPSYTSLVHGLIDIFNYMNFTDSIQDVTTRIAYVTEVIRRKKTFMTLDDEYFNPVILKTLFDTKKFRLNDEKIDTLVELLSNFHENKLLPSNSKELVSLTMDSITKEKVVVARLTRSPILYKLIEDFRGKGIVLKSAYSHEGNADLKHLPLGYFSIFYNPPSGI